MKVLLLQPPVQDFYDTDLRLQPIGLAYLKAAARERLPEVQVKIIDFHHGWGRHTIPPPEELDYLRPYYAHADESPFCTFHQYYHFGASFERIGRVIAAEKPDLVGISSLFTPYHREALRVAGVVKERSRAPVVLGGSHVSADPVSVLQDPAVDFVIRGEGEEAFVEFLTVFLSGRADWPSVPGLGYKRNHEIHLNPVAPGGDLNVLPFPDLTDLAPRRYLYRGRPMVFLITSRSCPHRCSFCSVHTTFGTAYRRLDVARVIEEMKLRYREGYRVFDFEDDNLTYYRKPMKALCREILREFPAGDIELLAMNGISYLSLDPELLVLMKAAGFTRLNLALVSSDRTVRETTKRPHTVEKYLEVVQQAHQLGFRMTSYQILGLPFESLASMIQTLCFQARLPVLLGASLFYLTPSSPIVRQTGLTLNRDDYLKSRLTAMAIEANDFTRDDLYTLFVTTRILNFLKAFPAVDDGETSVTRLLATDDLPPRRRSGLEILRRLLDTGVLYAKVGGDYRPLTRFRAPLFSRVWNELGFICTENGTTMLTRVAGRTIKSRGNGMRAADLLPSPLAVPPPTASGTD